MTAIQEMDCINLYSDTQTLPTDEMREAMYEARVGDDMYRNDPTVHELEEIAAQKLGKDDALFVPSGHMGNLISVMVHCNHGDEVILDSESHIYYYESGSLASIAGVMPRLINAEGGVFTANDIETACRHSDIHFPTTQLISLESPHNRYGGSIVPLDVIEGIRKLADKKNFSMHLDGARIFNAAFALEVDAADIASNFDSVMFCLSKGLSAPVGSIIAGNEHFISKAFGLRKLLGGGMRQAGVLAAAGVVALEKMVDRLVIDNKNAKKLGKGFDKLSGYEVDLDTVQTNMIYVDVRKLGLNSEKFVGELKKYNIQASTRPPYQVRFVTNRHFDKELIPKVLDVAKHIADERGVK